MKIFTIILIILITIPITSEDTREKLENTPLSYDIPEDRSSILLREYVNYYNFTGMGNYTLIFSWLFIDILAQNRNAIPYYIIKWEYFKPYKILDKYVTDNMNGTYSHTYNSYVESEYLFRISISMWLPIKLMGQIEYYNIIKMVST